MRAGISLAVGLTLVTGLQSAARNAPQVEAQIVGSFGGFQWTVPTAINNKGDVVGSVSPTGTMAGHDAFLWTRKHGFQRLAQDAVATDINNRGDVTGYRFVCTTDPDGGGSCALRGFVWNAQTGFTELGTFVPMAINNSGDMAGECATATGVDACAMHNGVVTVWTCELDSCAQGARGINARGDAAGWRSSPDVELAMFFPRDGEAVVLESPPGAMFGPLTAEDINDAGTIAGRAPTDISAAAATLWTSTGLVQEPSAASSVAWAVNARGWTAGVRFDGDDAFFWDGSESGLVLLAPDSTTSEATDINDRGEIVGSVTSGFQRLLVIWRVGS
ncbi:MAG: hypothetical protein WBC51_08185 [Vicinamibacterales bacterium]